MKLHLPSRLRAAVLACLGLVSSVASPAIVGGSLAWTIAAQHVQAETSYGGLIYTWDGGSSLRGTVNDLAFGRYVLTNYADGNMELTDTVVEAAAANWNDVQAIICNPGENATNTLRFASGHGEALKTPVYTFTPLKLAGIVVESGAVGYSIASSGNTNRALFLGNTSSTSYSSIKENFSISVTSTNTAAIISMIGTQVWDVVGSKTYTVRGDRGITAKGSMDLTVQGGGAAVMTGALTMESGSRIAVSAGSSLTLVSGITGTGSISNAGTLTLGGTIAATTTITNSNTGTVNFDNVKFDITGITPENDKITLIGGSGANLSSLTVAANLVGGKTGYQYTFNSDGTLSAVMGNLLVWKEDLSEGVWNTSNTNWEGDKTFTSNANVEFNGFHEVTLGENITAGNVVIGNEAMVSLVGDGHTLNASALEVNAMLYTDVAIEGLSSVQIAEECMWMITGGVTQTLAAGTTVTCNGMVAVDKDTTLAINDSAAAGLLLPVCDGEGNIKLGANAVLNGVGHTADAPAAPGTIGNLTVGTGAGNVELKIGRAETGGAYQANYANIKSFSSVDLDSGTLWFHTNTDEETAVNNLTVTEHGGTIHVQDTSAATAAPIILGGVTTVNEGGTLTLQGQWKHKIAIEELAGGGTLALKGASGNEDTSLTLAGSIGAVRTDEGKTTKLSMLIGSGKELQVGTLTNSWGLKTLTVDGTLSVTEAVFTSGSTDKVAGSGVVNVGTLKVGNAGTYVFGGEGSSLRVNIGEGGIVNAGSGTAYHTKFDSVTIGATSGWSSAEALELANTVTVDTDGNDVTLSGVLSGGAAKLTKTGEGTLTLGGQNTFGGGVQVDGGTVQASHANALGTGNVTQTNGVLQVSAAVDLSSVTLGQTGGSISVDAEKSLTLGGGSLASAIAAEGSVSFTGSVTLANTMKEDTIPAGHINEFGRDDENNGFVKGSSTYVEIVTKGQNAVVNVADAATFSYKGKTYAKKDVDTANGRIVVQEAADTDWTTFEIATATHKLSEIQTEAGKHESAKIATVKIAGGALNVDSTDLAEGVIEATSGAVTLNQGVGTVKVGATTGELTISGDGVADSIEVGDTATIGGAFHSSAFNVVAGKTATVKGDAAMGMLEVNGTLALEGKAAATGGVVQNLTTTAGSALTIPAADTRSTAGDLELTTASGSGAVNVGGSLTLNGVVELGEVTAGSVVLKTGSRLTLSGNLDSENVDIATVSTSSVMVTAGGLSSTTSTNFTVDVAKVADLGLLEGQTVILAELSDSYSGTLKVNNAGFIYRAGDQLSYAISQDKETNNIILTAQAQKGEFVWDDDSSDGNWGTPENWSGNKVPTAESWVQLDSDANINMDVAGEADRLTVYGETTAVLSGNNPLDINSLMEVNAGGEFTIGADGDATEVTVPEVALNGTLGVAEGASLEADSITMTSGALNAEVGSTVATGVLTGDADSVLAGFGTVTITGKGTRYQGKYEGATVAVAKGGDAVLYAGESLNLAGAGSAQLVYTKDTAISGIHAEGLALTLNHAEADNSGVTLVLEEGSSLKNGKILTGLSAVGTAATIDSADAPHLVSTAGASLKRSMAAPGLDLTGSTVVLTQSEGADVTQMEVNNGGKTKGLVLAYLGAANTESVVQLNGNLFAKYYKNARLVGGEILVDMNDTYYQGLVRPTTANGRAGAAMLDDAFVLVNPQQTAPDSDLAKLMDALESGAVPASAADSVAAAVSGASAAAMGAAFGADVERQLRAIRNRTTSMGCAECVVNEEMPYVNAWVNAEGDYRKLDADSTLAGYKMSSWGATLGVDLDFTNRFTAGLAVTAMQGDFTADSAETATGDLDRLYLSAFARYSRRAWTHTFVGTFGKADANLKRTVDYGTGTYSTKGDLSGTAFGLMYEVGYTKALTEDASVCLQPVFNISYRHSSLGSYTETGSDAALRMGDMEMDTVTFGLGARMQGTIGTSVYNRTSVVELRALAKLDAGDRDCAAKAGIAGLPAASHEVQSAEYGAFGLEVGAGLMVPLGEEGGTLFFDAAAELRSGYSNVNGTVGYRFNF